MSDLILENIRVRLGKLLPLQMLRRTSRRTSFRSGYFLIQRVCKQSNNCYLENKIMVETSLGIDEIYIVKQINY